MTEVKKKRTRKPSELMPGGKYMNLPIVAVQDLYVLLWNIGPNTINKMTPDQAKAMYKQIGVLLKASGWRLPDQKKKAKK